jgi:hypothetical protein
MLRYVKLPATQYNISTSETLNLAQKMGFVWLYFPLCVFSVQLIMYYIVFIFLKKILKCLIILSHLWLNATDWQTLQQLCHVGHSALCSFHCWLEHCSCHRMSWQMQSPALLHEMIKERLCIFRSYTDALYHHLLQESYVKEHTASKLTYVLIPFIKFQTWFDQYRLSLGTYKLTGV